MSQYLVSARKYRPQTFGELVGQEHVAETLRNALRLDRLAHAYLFSGPRGVGKTTAARILAKAINCEVPLAERAGAEPCRACASCRDFEEGRSLNIIEIDAASNNKVDDIRELRETVRIPPQGARRKVYIVDEVHMLSTSAFNALLKTLEEPPPYVLFIFATTEPHKVLPTILSRCQRFDFRRIAVDDAVGHLRHICAEEGFTADEASLMLIARKGDGALRDTLSAFDQAVALVGQDIRYDALAEALGVVGVDRFFEVTDAVQQRSGAALLQLVDALVRRGHDLPEFLVGLQEHLRHLLVARTLPDGALIEADEATRARYQHAARAFAEPDLLRLLALVAEAEDALKTAAQPRLRLELTLLKMVALASVRDLNAALNAVARLEKMAREGTLPAGLAVAPSTPAPPTASRAAEAPAAYAPSPPGGNVTHDAPAPAPGGNAPHDVPGTPVETPYMASLLQPPQPTGAPSGPTPQPTGAPSKPAPAAAGTSSEPAPPVSPTPRPDPPSSDDPPPPAPTRPNRPIPPAADTPAARPGEPELSLGSLFSGPALKRRADRGTPEAKAAAAPAPDVASEPALAEAPPDRLVAVQRAWSAAVRGLGSARLVAALSAARPLALDAAGHLTVEVASDLAAHSLEDAADRLREALAPYVAVRGFRASVHVPAPTGDGAGTAEPDDPYALVRRLRQDVPVAAALLDALGGEVA